MLTMRKFLLYLSFLNIFLNLVIILFDLQTKVPYANIFLLILWIVAAFVNSEKFHV